MKYPIKTAVVAIEVLAAVVFQRQDYYAGLRVVDTLPAEATDEMAVLGQNASYSSLPV